MLTPFLVLLAPLLALAELHTSIRPVAESIDFSFRNESFLVEFTITNRGSEDVRFLPFSTPLEFNEDIFTVQEAKSGLIIQYTGPRGYRGHIVDDHFITLAAGESRSVIVDLTRAYKLPVDGEYTVTLRDINYEGAAVLKTKNAIVVTAHNTHSIEDRFINQPMMKNGCSSTENSRISSAHSAGRTIAGRGRNCVSGSSPSCGAYRTFLDPNVQFFSTVQRCMTNINNHLPNARFRCHGPSCGSLWAYVHPDDTSQTIWLCRGFFDRPAEGSRTMVHEQSHFTRTCDTHDFAFNDGGTRDLARRNPSQAVRNADSYAFFARNA
jgi:peptidyl-Lys metalloendopeptidase